MTLICMAIVGISSRTEDHLRELTLTRCEHHSLYVTVLKLVQSDNFFERLLRGDLRVELLLVPKKKFKFSPIFCILGIDFVFCFVHTIGYWHLLKLAKCFQAVS